MMVVSTCFLLQKCILLLAYEKTPYLFISLYLKKSVLKIEQMYPQSIAILVVNYPKNIVKDCQNSRVKSS